MASDIEVEGYKTWDKDQVKVFLEENGIQQDTVAKLYREGFTGRYLIEFRKENYLDIDPSLLKMEIQLIINLKSDLLSGKLTPVHPKKPEIETPRPFGVGGEFSYTLGNLLPCENSTYSPPERSREYKAFSLGYLDGSKEIGNNEPLQKRFTDKSGKFLSACFNRRCNGTIYFGVSDGKTPKEHKHGEITGMKMSFDQRRHFEDWFEAAFKGKDCKAIESKIKEEKMAIQSCITVHWVTIKDRKGLKVPDRHIMEIDIEPKADIAKTFRFKVGGTCYVREGTSSVPYKTADDLKKFERSLPFFSKMRKDCEDQKQKQLYSKLFLAFCRDQPVINDVKYNFFLITDSPGKLHPNQSCTDTDLDWMNKISWKAVFDFSDPEDSQVRDAFETSNTLVQKPAYITADRVKECMTTDHSGRKLREDNSYGMKTLLIECNDSKHKDFLSWRSNMLSELNNAFDRFTDSSMVSTPDSMVLIFSIHSEKAAEKINEFLRNVIMKPERLQQCIFWYEDEMLVVDFHNTISMNYTCSPGLVKNSLDNAFIKVQWNNIGCFIERYSRLNTTVTKQIPSRHGGYVPLKENVYDEFLKHSMKIVCSNECEDLKGQNGLTAILDESNKEFMSGKKAPWELFLMLNTSVLALEKTLTCGFITREMFVQITGSIRRSLDDGDMGISILELNHLPGAGGSTLGRHVIWSLKEEYRCLEICEMDLETVMVEDIASKILSFRAFGESEDAVMGRHEKYKCKQFVILLDDSSTEMATILRNRIQDLVTRRKIKYTKTMGVILHIKRRSVGPKGGQDANLQAQFFLDQKFSEDEARMFYSKLKELERDYEPKDMLGFIIFVDKENSNQTKVQNILDNIISGIANPPELDLLLYLSIFRFYGVKKNLSLQHCKLILKTTGEDVLNYVSDLTRMLLTEKTCSWEGFGQYKVLEVSYVLTAKLLIPNILKRRNETLKGTMLKFMENKTLMNHRFLKDKLMADLKSISVQRQPIENPAHPDWHFTQREPFSPLVLRLLQIDRSAAIEYLRYLLKIFEERPHYLSIVHQTIARVYLYLEHEDFDEVLREAYRSVSYSPHAFVFYDTVGQVYKKWLLKESDKAAIEKMDLNRVLELAQKAAENFRKSQSFFEEMNSTAKMESDIEGDTGTQGAFTGYIAEMSVNIHVGKTCLSLLKDSQERTDFKKLICNEEVSSMYTLKRLGIDESHACFLRQLYDRTCMAMQKVLGSLESKQIDIMRTMIDRQADMEYVFSTNALQKIESRLNSKLSLDKKVKIVENCFQIFGANFYYIIQRRIENKSGYAISFTNVVRKMLKIVHRDKIPNKCKVSALNISFSILVKHFKNRYDVDPVFSYHEACKLSHELASVPFDKELSQYETYFWYMALHWPVENEKKIDSYDENLMVKCIRLLKRIQDDNKTIIRRGQNEIYRSLEHKPLFFLKDGEGYQKLEPSNNGHKVESKRLNGKVKNDTYIELELPGGKSVDIRAAFLRVLRGSTFEKVTFQLGFTLAGPVAYYIDVENRLKNINDGPSAS